MRPLTGVVKNLILINVVVFIAAQIFPQYSWMGAMFEPGTKEFMPHQIVTHMFMHGGVSHIAFNMLSLYFLGPIVEQTIGEKKFLLLYFISGFGAIAIYALVWYFPVLAGMSAFPVQSMFPVLGASGAVYGVVIGMAYLYPDLELQLLFPPIPIKAKYMAIGLIVLGLYLGMSGRQSGVAHAAHLGGALFGFLTLYFWNHKGMLGRKF